MFIGKDKVQGTDTPAFESVVMEMVQPISNKGYIFYVDSLFIYYLSV